MHSSWKLWAAAGLSAALLELPFPLAGPMPPWRSVFAWFALVPLLWAVLSHPSRKNKEAVRKGHPAGSKGGRESEARLDSCYPTLNAQDASRMGHPGILSAGRGSGSHPLRRAFLLAYLCGVLWYVGNCYWIYDTMHIYGGIPSVGSFLILLLFSLVLGLYFGLFGLGVAMVQRATGSTRLALVFAPFLWAALELAAARITSVPWDQLGYSQVDNGFVNQLAPWTGVYGISFVLVAVNALISGSLILKGKERTLSGLAAGFVLAILTIGATWTDKHSADSPTSATAVLVQPNLDVSGTGYWLKPDEWDQHITEFTRLGSEQCKTYIAGIPQTGAPTGEIVCPPYPTHPDLVVLPESPAPFFEEEPRFQRAMAAMAHAEQAPLIVNGVGSEFSAAENTWQDHVSAMAYNADGNEVGRYDKIHLVPFGEFVPFARFFFFARKLTGKVASYTPGSMRKVFLLAGPNGAMHRYGVFICYESVFADEVRQFAKRGAEVFVNVSDDGWYGDTSAPWQHLNMARMRAVENRRWILRDTNNGVTAVIDPYGRVRQSIPRHQVDALPAEFGFNDYVTFYSAHGDVFAWLCALMSLGIVGWAGRRILRRPVGLWKNRADLQDSESFVRELRNDCRQERLKAD
jgi:apolipoprotein N-acyltransferase